MFWVIDRFTAPKEGDSAKRSFFIWEGELQASERIFAFQLFTFAQVYLALPIRHFIIKFCPLIFQKP